MKWLRSAPSNIALIKYMGKANSNTNIPSNASFSYTLNDLLSYVELETHSGTDDYWEPLQLPGANESAVLQLPTSGQQRFLAHLQYLKSLYHYEGHFIVRSCNNFPMATGLASSASSFAALTRAAVTALIELTYANDPTLAKERSDDIEAHPEKLAPLSRKGSGSSARSFFSPWALWEGEEVHGIELPYQKLIHHVVIVSHAPKEVSSSEAHRRVITSRLFQTRLHNVNARLKKLLAALNAENWRHAYEVCFEEFLEMHELFHTSKQPFSYITEKSKALLKELQNEWQQNGDGPLITMDAGPNIHLLFRSDQKQLAEELKRGLLLNHDVI